MTKGWAWRRTRIRHSICLVEPLRLAMLTRSSNSVGVSMPQGLSGWFMNEERRLFLLVAGGCYERERGVARDLSKAAAWYAAAAAQGHKKAQYNIGMLVHDPIFD